MTTTDERRWTRIYAKKKALRAVLRICVDLRASAANVLERLAGNTMNTIQIGPETEGTNNWSYEVRVENDRKAFNYRVTLT